MGGWVAQRKCVRCMQWLCCVFGDSGFVTLCVTCDLCDLCVSNRYVLLCVCVFITAGPITKLCAWGRRIVEDMCYEIRRAEACVD